VASTRKDLLAVIDEARAQGFAGPPTAESQVTRSLAFKALASAPPARAVDLGSGGGIPALALAWPSSQWVLVESNQRRARWLGEALVSLELSARCEVVCQRAEEAGRGHLRQAADLVTARSFASPGPTAECGAPLLRLGGELLVADPPEGGGRWPASPLSALGAAVSATEVVATDAGPVTITRIVQVQPCPDRYPRRVGVPFKRPLF
jgi:16S rRNA (guanine527-N7)-methyltransferase